jgi:sugar/nucleoside kinase (ribokinase family)
MTLIDDTQQTQLLSKLKNSIQTQTSGGSAANTLIAAQQLGALCFYSCKVANDETGLLYKKNLHQLGLQSNLQNQTLQAGKTGKCVVMVSEDADRTMNTFLGVTGEIDYSYIDEKALRDSHYLYIEGYLASTPSALKTAIRCMHFAKQHQIKTAFSLSDPNIVHSCFEGLSKIIAEGVDLLFCNESEAFAYTQENDLNSAIKKLASFAQTLIVTRGIKGAIIFHENQSITINAYPVKAVDTNGAGDLFAGAFLSALAKGASLKESGDIASYASALLVTEWGSRLSSQNVKNVNHFVTEKMKHRTTKTQPLLTA